MTHMFSKSILGTMVLSVFTLLPACGDETAPEVQEEISMSPELQAIADASSAGSALDEDLLKDLKDLAVGIVKLDVFHG